jgi:TolA-binding protein
MGLIFASPADLPLIGVTGLAHAQSLEQKIPSEDGLWRGAGNAFAEGTDQSAAMQQYRLFVKTYGGSEHAASAQYMLAECYFASGDYETALQEYERVHKFKGDDKYIQASVLLRSAECQFNLHKFAAAIDTYDQLISKYEDSFLLAEGLYEAGRAYIANGNWLKLELSYKQLLEARPGYAKLPQVKFALGLFAYRDQNYEQALAYFKEVPNDRGLFYMGKTLEDMGQYILAIQRYRQVLRKYPDSPLRDDVAFSIAEAFYHSKQNELAVRSYRSFIDEYSDSPFLPNARYKLACITYREGDFDESIRQLKEVCALFPGQMVCAYARYLIGDAYMRLDDTSDAIFSYTDVVRNFGDSKVASAALHKIVYGYAHENNFGQTIQMAEEFLRRFPGDPLAPRVHVLKGYAHLMLDEQDQAVRDFQNVLDKNVNTDVAERALFLSTYAYSKSGQYDRLITNYNYIAKRLLPTPSHWRARTYYYLGEAYYAQGLYKASNAMYRLVLTGYPRSNVAAASLQGLVASYSQMGEYDVALDEQRKFLLALANSDSDEGTNSLAVGSIYFNQHKYEDALRQYQDFLSAHPDDPEAAGALLNAGDSYYRLQYYDQAIKSWGDLLTRFPDSKEAAEGLYRIADTQFGLGKFEAAHKSYNRLATQYPNGKFAADAAFGLANCAYNLGQDEAAIAAFGAFVKSYPKDPRVEDAQLGIQSCYYRSGKDMEEYLSKFPDSALAADIFWNKGQAAFGAGDYATAARAFEKVTLDYPESESGPAALYYLAESYYRMDQLEPALAGFRNFVTTHPDHDLAELAQFRLGTVLFKLEKFEAAAREYETMRDRFPNGEYAALGLFNTAICYQQTEDWTAAIASYEEFLKLYPTHEKAAGLWLEIASIDQDELGAYGQAIEAYGKALANKDGNPVEIRYRQGECHEKAKDIDSAINSYREAGKGSGDDPFVIAALAKVGELLEDRGDFRGAVKAYQDILAKATKPEWTAMAQSRVDALQEKAMAGR